MKKLAFLIFLIGLILMEKKQEKKNLKGKEMRKENKIKKIEQAEKKKEFRKNFYYFIAIVILLVSIFSIYRNYVLLPSPFVPEVKTYRVMQQNATIGDEIDVKIVLELSDNTFVDSAVISEKVPDNFEILGIEPEPLFLYKDENKIVWGGKNYKPDLKSEYAYRVKVLDKGNRAFSGVVSLSLGEWVDRQYNVMGRIFLRVYDEFGLEIPEQANNFYPFLILGIISLAVLIALIIYMKRDLRKYS